MSIEPTVVLSRLEFMGNYLLELRRFRGMSLEDYLSSFDQKTISERIMELIGQAAIDINEHILTRDKNIQPLSNKDSFIKAKIFSLSPIKTLLLRLDNMELSPLNLRQI